MMSIKEKEPRQKMKLMTETEYAMYKGDRFIDLGTLTYLAEKYHKRQKTLKFLATPSAHKRSCQKSLLLYRINEDESHDL